MNFIYVGEVCVAIVIIIRSWVAVRVLRCLMVFPWSCDYVMMMMSNYGSLRPNSDQEESLRIVDGNRITFSYNNVVGNHYKFRGAVDEHNAKRHDGGTNHGLSLEETWQTTRWACRVFFIHFIDY